VGGLGTVGGLKLIVVGRRGVLGARVCSLTEPPVWEYEFGSAVVVAEAEACGATTGGIVYVLQQDIIYSRVIESFYAKIKREEGIR
jgi:hypothetical protein